MRNFLGSSRLPRAGQRGFSLIELGIVVAVIGILATVVLVGRGFLTSSRASKAVELLRTVHSAVNFYTANHGDTTDGINLPDLQADGKVPKDVGNITGISGNQFTVDAVAGVVGDPNRYVVTYTCDGSQARLCWEACQAEERNKAIFVSGTACVNTMTTGTNTYMR